jgi:hypothetical protein
MAVQVPDCDNSGDFLNDLRVPWLGQRPRPGAFHPGAALSQERERTCRGAQPDADARALPERTAMTTAPLLHSSTLCTPLWGGRRTDFGNFRIELSAVVRFGRVDPRENVQVGYGTERRVCQERERRAWVLSGVSSRGHGGASAGLLDLVANSLKPGGQREEASDVGATPALPEFTGKVSSPIRPGM